MQKVELIYVIIRCAIKVYNTLGPGFQKAIYQQSLAIELDKKNISFAREQPQTIYSEGVEVSSRRADFLIANKVVVELKATIRLEDIHLAETKNYTIAYDFPKGLLINFGGKSLEYKLLFNPKYNQNLQNT